LHLKSCLTLKYEF